MEILYFGSLCDKYWFENTIMKNNAPYTVAQYMFESSMVEELCINNNVSINYIYRDSYFPKNKHLFFRKNKKALFNTSVKNISFINLPFIKEICMILNGFIITINWAIKTKNTSNKAILLAIQYPPFAFGVKLASKIMTLKRVLIITDVSQSTYNKEKIKEMPLYKRFIMSLYKNMVKNLEESYDAYIFFSQAMNNLINKKNKKNIVVEGIFNFDDIDLNRIEKEYAIMHAGTLSKEVGVKKIIDVFMEINDEKLELWLFGDGNLKEYITEMQKIDSRIKYFGFRSRAEVFEYEKKATLLINLRNPKDEYTKYSFPSKTFEYMVSGTPFMTTELECIPYEYKEHLIIIKEEYTNSIKNEIERVLAKRDELDEKGMKARHFILENKTAKKQVKKINDLLMSL